jgi:hypothetical protein
MGCAAADIPRARDQRQVVAAASTRLVCRSLVAHTDETRNRSTGDRFARRDGNGAVTRARRACLPGTHGRHCTLNDALAVPLRPTEHDGRPLQHDPIPSGGHDVTKQPSPFAPFTPVQLEYPLTSRTAYGNAKLQTWVTSAFGSWTVTLQPGLALCVDMPPGHWAVVKNPPVLLVVLNVYTCGEARERVSRTARESPAARENPHTTRTLPRKINVGG